MFDLNVEAQFDAAFPPDISIDISLDTAPEIEVEVDASAQPDIDIMVAVPGMAEEAGKPEQTKSLIITENGNYEILPDDGYALSEAHVEVDVESEAVLPAIQALEVTENGTYTAPDGVDGYSPISVNVPSRYDEGYADGYDASQNSIRLQEKTATENGEVTPDEGYTGLSKVTVNVEAAAAEYTRAGYIQFTGGQIVDTRIVCSENTKIRVVFTRDSSASQYMYGVVNAGNTASVTAYLSSGGAWRFGNKSVSRSLTVNSDLVHCAIVSSAGIVSGGGTNSYNGVSDFETIGSLLIGTCRQASGAAGTPQFVGKILEFEMWEGSAQVLKLIPVILADGTYVFRDEVSQEFFASITDVPLEGGIT